MGKEQIIQITIFPGNDDNVVVRRHDSEIEMDVDQLIDILGYFVPKDRMLKEYRDDLIMSIYDNDFFRFYKIIKNMTKRCIKGLE